MVQNPTPKNQKSKTPTMRSKRMHNKNQPRNGAYPLNWIKWGRTRKPHTHKRLENTPKIIQASVRQTRTRPRPRRKIQVRENMTCKNCIHLEKHDIKTHVTWGNSATNLYYYCEFKKHYIPNPYKPCNHKQTMRLTDFAES